MYFVKKFAESILLSQNILFSISRYDIKHQDVYFDNYMSPMHDTTHVSMSQLQQYLPRKYYENIHGLPRPRQIGSLCQILRE